LTLPSQRLLPQSTIELVWFALSLARSLALASCSSAAAAAAGRGWQMALWRAKRTLVEQTAWCRRVLLPAAYDADQLGCTSAS
jgi:phosphatidylglycerophosphate synthase